MEKIIKEYISKELNSLDRTFVATPSTRKVLDEFAQASRDSNLYLLTQMAVQFGYQCALQNVAEELKDFNKLKNI
jgi:hypothetical protein|tara:strand:- start:473 stop:697 length:225 start_codon:yes stop_codon:yes gene_type:complete